MLTDSIKEAASIAAAGMVNWYAGGVEGQIVSQIPGLLPQPYYWWEAGAMFGQMIEYRSYTGDESYDDIITEAMMWQASPTNDFMPTNQTATEGNDDQVFWAFAAMSAAETNFPDPAPHLLACFSRRTVSTSEDPPRHFLGEELACTTLRDRRVWLPRHSAIWILCPLTGN